MMTWDEASKIRIFADISFSSWGKKETYSSVICAANLALPGAKILKPSPNCEYNSTAVTGAMDHLTAHLTV